MNRNSSGVWGVLGLIGGVIVLLLARQYMPSLANLLLTIAGICILLLVLFVAAVMYFALKKPKQTEEQKASGELQSMLKKGKEHLMALRRMSMEIKNSRVRTLCTEISGTIDKILRTLREQPERISSMGQFFRYYLPTLEKILVKYKEIESSGVPTEEITQSTITCLEDISVAMGKQYQNLFENDMLDLTVEMEVLTQICKRDGLLTDEDFCSSEQNE